MSALKIACDVMSDEQGISHHLVLSSASVVFLPEFLFSRLIPPVSAKEKGRTLSDAAFLMSCLKPQRFILIPRDASRAMAACCSSVQAEFKGTSVFTSVEATMPFSSM